MPYIKNHTYEGIPNILDFVKIMQYLPSSESQSFKLKHFLACPNKGMTHALGLALPLAQSKQHIWNPSICANTPMEVLPIVYMFGLGLARGLDLSRCKQYPMNSLGQNGVAHGIY
jgi:hypothetical protein